jgi:riboflavin biosynthesis pyrimidine reductase
MIATVDGRAAVGGTAAGLGSELDRRLMRELRAEADVVLHGASTVRADPLSARVPPDLSEARVARGQPAQPVGAILTASEPTWRSPHVEVVRVGGVREMLDDLHRRGVRRIVCEGGPRLNAHLFEADLVDEIFYTISPRVVGGRDPLTMVHGGALNAIPLELRNAEQHGNELYLRYNVLR